MSSSHFYKGLFGAENFSGFSTKRATDPSLSYNRNRQFFGECPLFLKRGIFVGRW